MLSWGGHHLGPVSVPVARDQPPSTSLQRGITWRRPPQRKQGWISLQNSGSCMGQSTTCSLGCSAGSRDEGQELQMAPAALPLEFLALPVFAVCPELCQPVLGTQRCVLSPELCRATLLCSKSPCAWWALKLEAAHWFLAQTPILWNSIHPPSHLEGISHFEWINFIWLLPSTTMLLIHGPPQPLRWGQVHWAALSQTHLLVSQPLGTPLPLSVDYRWTPAALFIWSSYLFFF